MNIKSITITLGIFILLYGNEDRDVSADRRNTPQAFSHFSYEASDHQLIIVDIQGVGDIYTDPQIHSVYSIKRRSIE